MAVEPVKVERQSDGRHAVIGSNGQILGLHKSIWSAARQMHSYYGPTSAAAESATEKPAKAGTSGDHPPLPSPPVPRPGGDTSKIPAPKVQTP